MAHELRNSINERVLKDWQLQNWIVICLLSHSFKLLKPTPTKRWLLSTIFSLAFYAAGVTWFVFKRFEKDKNHRQQRNQGKNDWFALSSKLNWRLSYTCRGYQWLLAGESMNTLVNIIYLLSKFLTRFPEFQALTGRFNLGYVHWIQYRTPSTIF